MRFLYLVKSKIFFRIRRKRRLRSESQRTKRVQSSYEKKWTKILVCQGLLSANQLHFKKVSNLNYIFCQFEYQTDEVRLRRPPSERQRIKVLGPCLWFHVQLFGLKFRLTLYRIEIELLNCWIYFVQRQQVFYSSLNKTLHASSFFQSIFNYV